MTVRPATPDDRVPVVRMLRDAHKAGGLPFKFSAAHAVALFDAQQAQDRLCLIFDSGTQHGVLMASAQQHPFAPVLYAAEVVWWIDPEHRGKSASEMLAAYEAWAAERGCAFVAMAALSAAPRAGVIYERRGYRPAETHYIKPMVPAVAA
jgi:GNAT superfamily N-acetyltransferase